MSMIFLYYTQPDAAGAIQRIRECIDACDKPSPDESARSPLQPSDPPPAIEP